MLVLLLSHQPLMTPPSLSEATELEAAIAARSASALQELKDRPGLRWSQSDCAVALFEQPEH